MLFSITSIEEQKRIITFHNVTPELFWPQGKSVGLMDSEENFKMKMWIIKKQFKIRKITVRIYGRKSTGRRSVGIRYRKERTSGMFWIADILLV